MIRCVGHIGSPGYTDSLQIMQLKRLAELPTALQTTVSNVKMGELTLSWVGRRRDFDPAHPMTTSWLDLQYK